MQISFNVNSQDIEDARRNVTNGNRASSCPVATALNRILTDKSMYTMASYNNIYLRKGVFVYQAKTPTDLWSYIKAFDSGKDIEPSTFTVDFKALD